VGTRGWNSDTQVTEPLPDLPALPPLPPLPPLPEIGAVGRRPPTGGARQEWQRATVLEVRPETSRMSAFRLGLPNGRPHVPGQHVVLRLTADDGYSAQRSYSIASAPTDGSEIELLVERLDDGEVSGFLHEEVRVGDTVEVRGPFGGWFVWNGREPALLVGGGSGVVPLVAMLRYHRAAELSVQLRLVVSVRTPDDLPYSSLYGAETTVAYTRRTPPGWPRPAGRIDAATLEPLLIPGATAYVCGSASFAEAASQLLVELGMPAASVRVERYGPTS
jgi:ferredoxin-NADP reductase